MIVDPVIRLSHFIVDLPAFTEDTICEDKAKKKLIQVNVNKIKSRSERKNYKHYMIVIVYNETIPWKHQFQEEEN